MMKLLFKKFLIYLFKVFLASIACFAVFFGIMHLFNLMIDSGNMALMILAVAVMFLLIVGTAIFVIWFVIREMGKSVDSAPRPVKAELLGYETEGLGRMASAGLGSLFGGNLGMLAGFLSGGKKDVAAFLVTYSNGKEKIEYVKLNSLKYEQYKSLQR